MNYLLALLLPPLAILFAGRPFTAIVAGVLWFVTLALTLGMSHPIFVIHAWVVIAGARGDRRERRMIRALQARH